MREENEILLREYETCQSHNDHIGSQVWVSTTIFLSINVTLLGGLLYSLITMDAFSINNLTEITNTAGIVQFQILGPRVAATALGLGVIFILKYWKRWLKRMRFRTAVNFERMLGIESILGMCRHTICRRLDKAYENKNKWSSDERKDFEQKKEFFHYFPPSGFDGLIWIALILVVLWGLFIVYVWLPVIIAIL